jgi:putative hemolysin
LDRVCNHNQLVWQEARSRSLLQVHLEPYRLMVGAAQATGYLKAFLV